MTDDERILLQAAARVVLVGDRGSLASQLDRTEWRHPCPLLWPSRKIASNGTTSRFVCPTDLLFANGLGGFTPDGREYCVLVSGHAVAGTDRQWSADSHSPVHISAAGSGPVGQRHRQPSFRFPRLRERARGLPGRATARRNRLTPWSNDPVSDPPGEVVYLRDEESGEVWCPTPLPVPSAEPTLVRHGQGYTIFERNTHGLSTSSRCLCRPRTRSS